MRLAVCLFLAMAACGRPGADAPAFAQLAQQLTVKVDEHREASATLSAPGDCRSEHDRYDAELRPMVQRLTAMGADMDGCMSMMGKSSLSDMHATCVAMMSELDHYRKTACGSADVAQNRAEAERHCALMKESAARQADRAGQMMGASSMMSGRCCCH